MPHLLAGLLASPAAWLPGEAGADHVQPARVQLGNRDTNLRRHEGVIVNSQYQHYFGNPVALPQGYTRQCVNRLHTGVCLREAIIAPDGTDLGQFPDPGGVFNVLPQGYTHQCTGRRDGRCVAAHVTAPDGTNLGSFENLTNIFQVIRPSADTLLDIRNVYTVDEGTLNADGLLVNGLPMFTTFSAPTSECTQEAIEMCVDPAEHCPDVEQTSESQGVWENTSLTPITTCCTFAYGEDDAPPTKLSGVLEQARFVSCVIFLLQQMML